MAFGKILRPTNNRVRLGVGLVLVVLFCIQCTRSEAFRTSSLVTAISGQTVGRVSPQQRKELERLARKDHVALLKLIRQRLDNNCQDLTCTFIKQERIKGKLNAEQWMDVKYMDDPFSVAMRWVRNAPIGDRVLYVEGQHKGMMLVRPKGFLYNLVGTQLRPPDGPEAMARTLRPVTRFGLRHMVKSLLEVYQLARSRGEGTSRFLGYREVAGRRAMALERVLPLRKDYPARRTVWYLDAELIVPLGLEGHDWDDRLVCRYLFKDLKLNVGLTSEDFTPEANGMALGTN